MIRIYSFFLHMSMTLLLQIAALAVVQQPLLAGDQELVQFRQKYPQALDKLKEAYSSATLRGTFVTLSAPTQPESKPREDSHLHVIAHGDLKKLVYTTMKLGPLTPGKSSQAEYVMSFGQGYLFDLRRDSDTSAQYVITNFQKSADIAAIKSRGLKDAEFILRGGKYLWCTYLNENYDLSRVLDTELVRLDSGTFLTEGGSRRFRLQFSNTPRNPTKLRGTADLLPDRLWAVRRLETEQTVPVKAPGLPASAVTTFGTWSEVEYGADRENIPIPINVSSLRNGRKLTLRIDEIKLNPQLSPGEFGLSHFGLPDVSSPPADPSTNRSAYWFIGFGVTALIGAIVLLIKRFR